MHSRATYSKVKTLHENRRADRHHCQLTIAASAQPIATNPPLVAFLSVQHPEWPPMAAPPSATLRLIDLTNGLAYVLDEHWTYTNTPPAATNTTALRQIAYDAQFQFETNLLAARPELKAPFIELLKMDVDSQTNPARKYQAQRRFVRQLAELERITRSPATNQPH